MKRAAILIMAGIVLCGVGLAGADDLFPPDWRGQHRTVFAQWDTWGADWSIPAVTTNAPDAYQIIPDNQGVGVPEYYLDSSNGGTIWNWHISPSTGGGTRNDVVELAEDYDLYFIIPNFSGGDQKTLRIQVTYAVDDNWEPFVGPAWIIEGGEVVDAYFLDWDLTNGWATDVFELVIEPNPIAETIALYFSDGDSNPMYPAYVDQVVIDTICIPEPATMSLLALGGLAVLRRRRKR